MYTVKGQLEKADYWYWRHLISEMQLAEVRNKLARTQYSTMEKDLEIAKLRTAIFKETIRSSDETYNEAKRKYEEFRAELETKVGCSLKDCLIDEISLEIRELDKE